MPIKYSGDNITFPDNSVQNTAATGFGFKNRIINGAMVIDQRNSGASVTNGTSDSFPVDRMRIIGSQASKFTAQRSATAPSGFSNAIVCTSSSAYSVGATERFLIGQWIEGYNISDLGFGTASASTITLSFWVRSSLTGTFGGRVSNNDGSRIYIFSFTVNAANTYEYKTVTIPGDTSGTWLTDSNAGMLVSFSLGAGSSWVTTPGSWGGTNYFGATGQQNLIGTNGATFYITGVQLEKGSTATSFDYRPYGTELALCQRYFWKTNQGNTTQSGCLNGVFRTTTYVVGGTQFPVTMRAAPTVTRGGTSDTFYVSGYSATASYSSVTPTFTQDMMWAEWQITGGTVGFTASYNGQQSFSAEL